MNDNRPEDEDRELTKNPEYKKTFEYQVRLLRQATEKLKSDIRETKIYKFLKRIADWRA